MANLLFRSKSYGKLWRAAISALNGQPADRQQGETMIDQLKRPCFINTRSCVVSLQSSKQEVHFLVSILVYIFLSFLGFL